MASRMSGLLGAIAVVAVAALPAPAPAQDLQEVTYLLPAPRFMVAFAPMNLAEARGYYAEEGVSVEFITVGGGAEVATQVGAGNAPLGGGIGDTSIIVRPNGVPVRAAAILGGGTLPTVVARADRGIERIEDLAGRPISVLAFQDTTYYALLGVLGTVGLGQSDADIQAHGPAGIWQQLIAGEVDAMSAVPDWIVLTERAGIELVRLSSPEVFPSMAQAIITSDQALADNRDAVCGVVRAVLRALDDILEDPESASTDLIAFMEANQFPVDAPTVLPILQEYAAITYGGQEVLGRADPARFAAVQDFYLEAGIIRRSTPLEDLFTNECVE